MLVFSDDPVKQDVASQLHAQEGLGQRVCYQRGERNPSPWTALQTVLELPPLARPLEGWGTVPEFITASSPASACRFMPICSAAWEMLTTSTIAVL